MKHLMYAFSFSCISLSSFSQFTDTADLNTFIRDTINDRRPYKITASQLQKSLLGITRFLPIGASLNNKQVGYGGSNDKLTGNPGFIFNDATNVLQVPAITTEVLGTQDNVHLDFYTNNKRRARLDSLGRFSIDVVQNQSFPELFSLTNSDGTFGWASIGGDSGHGYFKLRANNPAFGPVFQLTAGYSTIMETFAYSDLIAKGYYGLDLYGGYGGGAQKAIRFFPGYSYFSGVPAASFTLDGNFLIGTTTDNGQKFQVAGTNGSFGVDATAQRFTFNRYAMTATAANNYIISSTPPLLTNLINASGNVGIGSNGSFQELTTGAQNVGFGDYAFQFLKTGKGNAAVGAGALQRDTSGNFNTAQGYQSLQFNTNQNYNIGIGTLSAGTAMGNNNISIGSQPYVRFGVSETIGNNNILLGYFTNVGSNTGSNNIVVGNSSSATSTNNSTVIGNNINLATSNTVIIGNNTQQTIIGGIANNGATLQSAGSLSLAVKVSSAATLTIDSTASHWVFSGTEAASWTLPPVAGHTGWTYFIKNRGTAAVTINSYSGNEIYDTSPLASLAVGAGMKLKLINDGTYWLVE